MTNVTKRHRLGRRKEGGAALVETALALPFLLILFMGVVDVARLFSVSIKLNEAVQEGALYGSYQPSDNVEIRTRVVESTDSVILQPTDVVVSCPSGDDFIRVSVVHDVEILTPFISNILGSTKQLSAQSEGTNFTTGSCDPSP